MARHAVDVEGRLVVELEHVTGEAGRSKARVRADAFALIGAIAEGSTFVRVEDADDGPNAVGPGVTEVDVVTGLLDDDTPFASHGHTLRLRITGR